MTDRPGRLAGGAGVGNGPEPPDRLTARAHPTPRPDGPVGPLPLPADQVVPSDETDLGWGELPDPGDRDDERVLREVPPHHVWP